MNLADYKFVKQFFICDSNFTSATNQNLMPPLFNGWQVTRLLNNATLHCHPKLNITDRFKGVVRLICLGSIINPYQPEQNNEQILNDIVYKIAKAIIDESDNKVGFDALESNLYDSGGRFVLIAMIADEIRIYHDAAGLKPVFYSTNSRVNTKHRPIIASQPALLAYLGVTCKNTVLFGEFEQFKNSSSWPINVVPYDNVKQLIPNHYLEFTSLTSNRFWPKENNKKRPQAELSFIVSQMNELLKGTVKALTLRNKCTLSLTGGYDSRMLFSCALAKKDNINFFTTVSDFTPQYEIDTATKIAQTYQLDHQFTQKKLGMKTEEKIITVLNENVGGMYYDRSRRNIFAFALAIDAGTHLPGSVSEIARCNYYPYGKKMRKPTGKLLAKYTGFKNNPIAAQGFDYWLKELPVNLSFNVLDMVYWEHRLGVWGSCGLTYREGVIEQVPPMNNRAFMALSLAADIKDRLPPHRLIREIIKANAPDLLDIPFNGEGSNKLYDTYPKIKYMREVLFGWVK